MLLKNNNGRLLLKLGVVLLVVAAITFATFDRFQKTAMVKAAKLDTAVDAVTGSVAVDADGGTVKELKSEGEGKVIECEKINVGASFKENDILVKLDDAELRRRVSEFRRTYVDAKKQAHIEVTGGKSERLANVHTLSDEDRAALYREVSPLRKIAAENLEKARRMHAMSSISDEDLKTAERNLETVDLGLQQKAFLERKGEQDFKAQLDTFDIELERMMIKAPSDGEITEALIWKGALIGRGHIIGKFMSHARIVTAKISEENFGRVQLGQKAKVRLLTYAEKDFDAVVSKMLPKADEVQRFTVFLDVKVDSQDQLKPNSTGEVTITVDHRPNAVMVPRVALFDSDKICVVNNGRVQKRKVKVGYINLTEAEILEGVAKGEHVIIDQPQRYRDGDRVRIEVLP
jgi:RND family efflux transporter MFP subunit